MKYRYSLALAAAGLLLLGAACSQKTTNTNVSEDTNVYSGTSLANTNATENDADIGTNTNANLSDDTGNTNSSTDENTVTNNSTLAVTAPAADDKVASPAQIKGTSGADVVFVRFTNTSGVEIFTVEATVRHGAFHLEPDFSFTNTTSGFIEVFEKDAAGAEVHLVKLPVTFAAAEPDDHEIKIINTNE